MVDRNWYSRKQGDPTVGIHMEVRGNSSYREIIHAHEIDDTNTDVSGGADNFGEWDDDEWRLVFSTVHGGEEIPGATGTGTAGNILVDGGASDGNLLITLTPTHTAAIETYLKAAGAVGRSTCVAHLYGVNANGGTETLFTAHVRVHFGTPAA